MSLYIFWPALWLFSAEGRLNFYHVEPKQLYKMYLSEARRVFFLNRISNSETTSSFGNMTAAEHVATGAYIGMIFCYFFLTFYTELLQLFMSFTLSRVVAGFVSDLRKSRGFTRDEVEGMLSRYTQLKRLGNHANAAVGRVTLFQMIDSLLYLPLGISNSLTAINWFTRVNYIFFICHFFLFTMHAASSPLKVRDNLVVMVTDK